MKPQFNAQPFVNEFGQVINPGDKVIAVSDGYNHEVKVRQGVFSGINYDDRGRETSVRVIVEVYRYDYKMGQYVTKQGAIALPRKRIYKIV
jgi:hypothetical protein